MFRRVQPHDVGVTEEFQALDQTGLAKLRARFDGCEVVALVEIETRTVLAWDSAIKLPQEHLDGLCTLAGFVFGAHTASMATAIVHRATGCRVFSRAPNALNEVLCVVLPDSENALACSAASLELLATDHPTQGNAP